MFDIDNTKDLIKFIRVLLWVGFIILFAFIGFELLVIGKSKPSNILQEPFQIFENIIFVFLLFLLFLLIELKPLKSIWRFIIALIPFSLSCWIIFGIVSYILQI